jgi:hypothetical protein
MPLIDGMKLIARAIDVVEEEKLWLLFCTKSILMTEPITFEDFCTSVKKPQPIKKKQKIVKKKTKEEIIADTIKINEKLKGGKKR